MINLVGVSDSLALFSSDDNAVVVDTDINIIVSSGSVKALEKTHQWTPSNEQFSDAVTDLVASALTTLDVKVIVASARKYTIPKGAQIEAKKALEWRKEHGRGGTPVGINTARTLADGGQIGIEKVRHVAKYFARHEIDKKAKGYKPGQDGFPSNGRIAWALWGGDVAWRWAQAIVDRENALTAGGDYEDYGRSSRYDADVDAFKSAYNEDNGPEFLARVRLDGSGIDRLYKIEDNGLVYFWDNTAWDDLGHVDGDIYTYDRALDDPYDQVDKSHVVIDPDSAIIISARFLENPFTNVLIEDIDRDEAMLMIMAMSEVDWDMVDYSMTAAGEAAPASESDLSKVKSENAQEQPRDAGGKFASVGSRVVIGGDVQNGVGNITKVNREDGTVNVKKDDGTTVRVPAMSTEKAEKYVSQVTPETVDIAPIDTTGILAEPRTPIDRPDAKIPGTLPAMTGEDLRSVINDWPSFVKKQRDSGVYQYGATAGTDAARSSSSDSKPDPRTPFNKGKKPSVDDPDAKSLTNAMGGKKLILDAYDHPLLNKWLNKSKRKGKSVSYQNRMWYQPITSAATSEKSTDMTPDNSDVQPMFMAIVSPDDPRAVLDLVSLVPAGSDSNQPVAYKRLDKKWVLDEGLLLDLKSATPPPVVPLDSETLEMVLAQVDGEIAVTASAAMNLDHVLMVLWGPDKRVIDLQGRAFFDTLVAAGGADRNRGNAESLRRYWSHGKGAAKIRWGTPGDWKRCVRHLSKYMGVRAKGYCQLRHKEATGMYTATHAKKDRARNNSVQEFAGELTESEYTLPVPSVYEGIPDTDLEMDIDAINAEIDEIYDADWEPEEFVIDLLEEQMDDDTDAEASALSAAGSRISKAIGNLKRGNAERLRLYWTTGKGGAKIRWNTGGDWKRCVRQLSKYMGPRARGYCALRHKEMTGMWTGDQKHRKMYGRVGNKRGVFSVDESSIATSEDIIEKMTQSARVNDARARVLVASGRLALATREDVESYIELGYSPEDDLLPEDIALIAAVEAGSTCPPATQDIVINLDNRKKAIDQAMYGPLNPGEPNEEYWSALGAEWNVDAETAKQQRCGNCAVFIQTPEMLSCIEDGLTDNADEFDSINEAGELGYCEIFDFKCASARTCRAWVAGGPVTAASGSKPAAKKDRIKGSSRNKKGSADSGAGVTFSAQVEKALATKVTNHNKAARDGRKTNIRALKAVYRRGAGAFSSSHRPGQNRNSWAMARVNAYLRLLKTGSPKNSKYVQDNDLLPASHPKSSKNKASAIVSGGTVQELGAKFNIPLVIPEELESGDGRKFNKEAIEIRELPLPLMWQIRTSDGHMGSVVVGRIDKMERTEQGIGNAYGVFDTGEYGKEAERLVRSGFLRGVSADMDKFEAEEEEQDSSEAGDDTKEKVSNGKLKITQARVMGVTIVPKPAFQECKIIIIDENETQEDTVIPNGVYVDEVDSSEAAALVACGMVAGAIPVTPPKSWFNDPKLKKATPITVTDEGQVFGHIAAWHVDHIGMAFGTKPPRSKSKYAYFHTGVVRTESGDDVPVGQLTLAGGHASLEASAQQAARHYDDTASAIADVHAGEDSYGIWVAGSLRPSATPEQIRALRASAPSGDWRPIKGSLELVAVCQVNVPGFPIARARVASGQVMALVAAGASVLARMKSDPVTELAARVQKLEQLEHAELSAKAEAAREKFNVVREEREATLSAMADEAYARIHGEPRYDDQFGYISRQKREALAKKGYALPDGSYPITNIDSLKDSIQAYGRGKPSKRAAIRRHIMKRARALDRADLIPDKWKEMSSSEEISLALEELRLRIPAITASSHEVSEEQVSLGKALAAEVNQGEGVNKYTPVTQPRDSKGKFRTVLARLKQDLGESGLQEALESAKETEQIHNAGNYVEANRSAAKLLGIIDRIDTRALNPQALENIRSSAGELGSVIANLPLPFGQDAEKVRFSDLPTALKDLIEDMISRVEDKIGPEDADVATRELRSFMAGGDFLNQREVSSKLSTLLRILT